MFSLSLVATITNNVCNKKYLFFTLKWSVKVNQHYQRDIKVSQHECGSESGGPPGCLQYYTATSGKIASFNYPTTSTSVSSTGAYFNIESTYYMDFFPKSDHKYLKSMSLTSYIRYFYAHIHHLTMSLPFRRPRREVKTLIHKLQCQGILFVRLVKIWNNNLHSWF